MKQGKSLGWFPAHHNSYTVQSLSLAVAPQQHFFSEHEVFCLDVPGCFPYIRNGVVQHLAVFDDQQVVRVKVSQILGNEWRVHAHGEVHEWVTLDGLCLHVRCQFAFVQPTEAVVVVPTHSGGRTCLVAARCAWV